MKKTDTVKLKKLLENIKSHLGHTKECCHEMTSRGEYCWCGYKQNHHSGKKTLEEQINEFIELL